MNMEWIADFPTTWPKPARLTFVLLFPITIPLWLTGWALTAAVTLVIGIAIIGVMMLSLIPALLWATWNGRRVTGAFDVVEDMYGALFKAVRTIKTKHE